MKTERNLLIGSCCQVVVVLLHFTFRLGFGANRATLIFVVFILRTD